MVNVKVGQTIRVYAAVWDFCSEYGTNAVYVSSVGIDTVPELDPFVQCQDITGITIEFKLGAASGTAQCHACAPETLYSVWGQAYTDSQGLAYIEHTVTEDDMAAYQDAASKGNPIKSLACITNSKGQEIIHHQCSETLTILPAESPIYAVDLHTFENMYGVLSWLSNYTGMLTATVNTLIPSEAGWRIHSTEVFADKGIIRFYLSETGSWPIFEIAIAIAAIVLIAIASISIAVFGFTVVGIGLAVASVIVASIDIVYLATQLIEQRTINENYKVKEGNETKRDQTIAEVLANYEKSNKTKDDCLNCLNGLKIAAVKYMVAMQKDFPMLYAPPIQRTFESTADNAIKDFKEGKITCERAKEIILTGNAIADADVDTNFTGNYSSEEGYTPPKEECWIPKPLTNECILSASTGQLIVGTVAVIGILGAAYWFVTRRPAEAKIVIERAKEEVELAKAAYKEIRAPPVPRVTGVQL